MLKLALCLGLLLTLPARAAEVAICFNYGCQSEANIGFAEPLIEQFVAHVQAADSARRLPAGMQKPFTVSQMGLLEAAFRS